MTTLRAPVRGIVGRLAGDPMLRNSLAIMATTVVTSLFGYAFWLIVAHTSGAAATGAGAATTSALQAAALFAAVGSAAAMVEWLPRCTSAREWRQRLTVGVGVAVVVSLAGSAVAIAVLGHLTGTLPELATPLGGVLFALGTTFFAVGIVYDYAAVAERSGVMMLARNTVFVAARIPLVLLPWFAGGRVLAAWAVAGGIALLVAAAGLRGGTHGRVLRPAFGATRSLLAQMRTSLVGQQLITITAMLGGYLLPVLVVARVSPQADAYFYATWMLGSVFFMVSPAVATSLFAQAAADPATIPAAAKRSGTIIGALLAAPMAFYLVMGGLLLSLFGSDYPGEGRALLALLTLSAIPDAVTNVAVAVLRATRRMGEALALNGGMLGACLALAWVLLPTFGIIAVGIAWTATQTAGALWVLASWRRISRP